MPDTTVQMEARLTAVERRADALDVRMAEFAEEIRKNTETTNSIKKDTSQIVALFKASEIGARIIKWCAGVGSALIIGYAALKGLTGH